MFKKFYLLKDELKSLLVDINPELVEHKDETLTLDGEEKDESYSLDGQDNCQVLLMDSEPGNDAWNHEESAAKTSKYLQFINGVKN